jgi:branched-chain amino acid transport system permease protein
MTAVGRVRRPTSAQLAAVAVLVGVAVVPPALTRAAPGVFDNLQAARLTVGATVAVMAISLNLLMGYAGQISLGHAALVAGGAYTSGILTGRYGSSFLVGAVAAAAAGAAIAFLVGLPALRLRGLYLAITTLGLLVVMQESVLQIPWLSRGSAGVELPRPVAGDFVFQRNADYLALVLVLGVLVWLVDANVVRTRLGRAFHGIRNDEQVAQAFGVDVARYKLLAFVLSGAIAGLAGALDGHLFRFVDSRTYDLNDSLLLVAIVVIGGLGSRVGAVVAGLSFGVMPEILRALEGWDLIVGAALLVVAMARHPGGIAGIIRETREARAVKRARAGLDDDEERGVPPVPVLPRPASLGGGAAVLGTSAVAPGEPLLEVAGVSVRFGGLLAVDGAGLVVPRGRIVGLIGPNGAGKTTLFNAVSGFVRPQAGSIRFAGVELLDQPPHRRSALGIGRTFQLVGLARDLSVRDNLLLAQHPLGGYGTLSALAYLPRAARAEAALRARADEAIAAIGFEAFAETPVRYLSGGQQRIVEMACALVTGPEMLMLDEPSAGMAPAVVESLAARLRDLRDELGRTVLLIEHHVPLVLDVCDEVYVLHAGRVLASGTPGEVVRHAGVVDAYLGSTVSVGAPA